VADPDACPLRPDIKFLDSDLEAFQQVLNSTC
jgi:hypothetical protein